MYTIEASNKFKKEFKTCLKRGLDVNIFEEVLLLLEKEGKLPAKFKPHKLPEITKDFGNAISNQIGY